MCESIHTFTCSSTGYVLSHRAALRKRPSEVLRPGQREALMTWLQRRPVMILLLFAVVAALLVGLALVGPSASTVHRGGATIYLADEGGD